jgi:Fe-S oxidoreductase
LQPEDGFQEVSLAEYEPQLWTCLNCFCGVCVRKCPAYGELQNEAVTARGLAQIGLALLKGEFGLAELSDELIYACTGCRWCEFDCSLNTPAVIKHTGTRKTRVSGATMTEILRALKVEQGDVPEVIKNALNNIAYVGNPYGKSEAIKNEWVRSLDGQFGGQSLLLYVGSTVPYEDRSTGMAEAVVNLLKTADVKFSLLGGEEIDSGAFARYMGEEGLFADLVERNTKLFQERGIKQIICLSPHDYDVFLSYYSLDGVPIRHYTEVIWELVKDGRIKFTRPLNKRVTYQDPCYLGRKHDIYDQPREILRQIPGLDLVEMAPNRQRAYCCGGGGAGLWYDLPKVKMNQTRIDQAREQGVQYLAVACPICLQMLDDGVKMRNYDIVVKDIAQIVLEGL